MTTSELYNKLICIFNQECLAIEKGNSFVIEECQHKNKDIFKQLKFIPTDACIIIKERLLGNANNSYRNNLAPHLNRSCDGIIVTEYKGKNFIILVELKTSFRHGISSGEAQLKASEFKILSLLECIEGFSHKDYQICALLALRKPTIEDVDKVLHKEKIGDSLNGLDRLMKDVYNKDIVKSVIDSQEYHFNQVPLKSVFCSDKLPLFIFTVQPEKDSGVLGLDFVLDSM